MGEAKKNPTSAIVCAFLANFIFGLSFLFTKRALTVSTSIRIIAGRFTVAFLVMTVLILARLVKVDYRKKRLGAVLIAVVCQPFAYFLFETLALAEISSALAGVIDSLIPVVVLLLSFPVNKEKPTFLQAVAVIISVGGVVGINLLSRDTGKTQAVGVLLMVGAALSSAFFNLSSRRVPADVTPFEKTYFGFGLAAVGFHLCGLVTEGASYFPSLVADFTTVDYLVPILFLSLFSSIGAFLLYNYAITRADAVTCSIFANVSTVLTVVVGVVFLNESFTVWQGLLCVPALAGVMMISLGGKKT